MAEASVHEGKAKYATMLITKGNVQYRIRRPRLFGPVDRSTAYLEVGLLFLQGLVDLLDHAEQQREFQRLERRARQGDSVVVGGRTARNCRPRRSCSGTRSAS